MPSHFLLIDDDARSAKIFVTAADRAGMTPVVSPLPDKGAALLKSLSPARIALNCDLAGHDPVSVLREIAATGSAASLTLFSRDPGMLAVALDAARLLGLRPKAMATPAHWRDVLAVWQDTPGSAAA